MMLSPTRDTIGVVSRSIDDVARFDAVLADEAVDDLVASLPERIAVLDQRAVAGCDAEVAAAYLAWVQRCTDRGVDVVEVDIDPLLTLNGDASAAISLCESVEEFTGLVARRGVTWADFVDAIASDDVRGIFASEPPAAEQHRHAIDHVLPAMRSWYETVLSDVEVLALPTMPVLPPLRTELAMMRFGGDMVPAFPTMTRFTSPGSLAGVPSLSLPAPCPAGPFGVMLEGPSGGDRALLGHALALDQSM